MKRAFFLAASIFALSALIGASEAVAQTGEARSPIPAESSSLPHLNQLMSSESFQRLWFFVDNNSESASVAVDTSGGIHMGFSAHTQESGEWPAYYAYCASDCANPANWTTTRVGNVGAFGGYTRLALNAAGHPRLFWYSSTSINSPGVYQYAECNNACTNPVNWTAVSLANDEVGPESTRYFALDPQGRPRYLYTDTAPDHTGTYYVYCDAGCGTSEANWHEARISSAYLLYDFSLEFTTTGGVRLAYRDATGSQDNVSYAECNANCGNSANWTNVPLYALGSGGAHSLRLDAQNRTRLALYTGYYESGDPANDLLFYAWCDVNCTQSSNWDNYGLGLPARYGQNVDLLLDQGGRPRLAYYVEDSTESAYGLGYAECSANCQNNSAAIWRSQFVETSDELNASAPIPVKSGCSSSSWMEVGRAPSLALDVAGNPRIGYTAVHFQGGTCPFSEDMRLVRFALAGSTNPPRPSLQPALLLLLGDE